MRLVFLGAPGVGKGTQAELLCSSNGWDHISTGVLLREAVATENALGLKAKEAMSRGDLVADDIILGLIEETLEKSEGNGFVLDGFPRNLFQAEELDELLERRGEELHHVVYLTVHQEEVVRRLAERGRADDTRETVLYRMEVYEKATAPLVGYYESKGLLTSVDGVGDIQEIQERVRSALGLNTE